MSAPAPGSTSPGSGSPRLTLITVGEFGSRVATRLAERYPGSEIIDATGGTHLATWPALDALVLAAGYDDATLVELVERAAYAWRRPWFPVLLEQSHLRCGPVVVPGVTACHTCFRRRRRQHARNPELWADTPAPAVAGTGDQVSGFANHHVGLAVGLATRAVTDAFDPAPDAPAGWVRTCGLADGSASRAGVVAVDGCTRCRDAAARERRPADLIARLRAALHGVVATSAPSTSDLLLPPDLPLPDLPSSGPSTSEREPVTV